MKEIKSMLSFFAVAGNILFILWILYNGINEGFAGTTMQKIIYFSMMSLLAINTFLILGKNK
jgi:hypothetical protein